MHCYGYKQFNWFGQGIEELVIDITIDKNARQQKCEKGAVQCHEFPVKISAHTHVKMPRPGCKIHGFSF